MWSPCTKATVPSPVGLRTTHASQPLGHSAARRIRYIASCQRSDRGISLLPPTVHFGSGREFRRLQVRAMVVHGYNRPFHWRAIQTAFRLGVKVYVRDDANLIARERTATNVALKKVFFRVLDRYVSGYLSVGKANRAYYLPTGFLPTRFLICRGRLITRSFNRAHGRFTWPTHLARPTRHHAWRSGSSLRRAIAAKEGSARPGRRI